MALVMPVAGNLVNRYGGGVLAVIGVTVTTLFTVPLALVGAHTAVLYLVLMMFFRGLGIGFSFVPIMTAAFASLDRSELSDATPQLNVLMRIGGSIGTAVLAVVLERATAHTSSLGAAASGFGTAFWWALGMTALAVIPSLVLMRAERRARVAHRGAQHEHEALESGAVAEALA
jgi:MFS family permease